MGNEKCLWEQQLKDRTGRENDPGVAQRLKCGDCEQAYIGETGRTACTRQGPRVLRNKRTI